MFSQRNVHSESTMLQSLPCTTADTQSKSFIQNEAPREMDGLGVKGKLFLPDGLLPLGLADLGLLVPLGHDLGQGGPSNGPLELNCAAGTLLCHLFLLTSKTNSHQPLICNIWQNSINPTSPPNAAPSFWIAEVPQRSRNSLNHPQLIITMCSCGVNCLVWVTWNTS